MQGQSERMQSRHTRKHKYRHKLKRESEIKARQHEETHGIIDRCRSERKIMSVNTNVITDTSGFEKVAGWRQERWSWGMSGWDLWEGVSLCLIYPAGRQQEDPRQSPDVTYCTIPSQFPYFLSVLEWCHRPAGDVTSTPPAPLCPSPLSPFSMRLQSLESHCDPGQSMEHVPNTDKKATMRTHHIRVRILNQSYIIDINHFIV